LERAITFIEHWENQAQNLKASLDGKIVKWRKEKEAMEKDNATLMILL